MLDGFDFGADVAEYVSPIKLWPTTGSRVGLVDADLLPYNIAYAIDPLKVLKAERRVANGECQLTETPEFVAASESLALRLNNWLEEAKCDSALLYMTKSDSNFRLDVAFSRPYKGQRRKDKPPFFYELRDFLISQLQAIMSDGEEADDLLSIEACRRNKLLEAQGVVLGTATHKEFCDFVIISADKDSRITPGWHYDPYTQKLTWGTPIGELEPVYDKDNKLKRIKGSGLRFFYSQLLTGDSIDNYTGIPRFKLAKVYELLGQLKTEKELYYTVLDCYKQKYGKGVVVENYRGTQKYYDSYMDDFGCPPPNFEIWKGRSRFFTPYELMLEQGRLAYMQQFKGEIWRSQSYLPLGSEVSEWS